MVGVYIDWWLLRFAVDVFVIVCVCCGFIVSFRLARCCLGTCRLVWGIVVAKLVALILLWTLCIFRVCCICCVTLVLWYCGLLAWYFGCAVVCGCGSI